MFIEMYGLLHMNQKRKGACPLPSYFSFVTPNENQITA